MEKTFPAGFLIGTSTSAFQIESVRGTNWNGFRTKDGNVYSDGIAHDSHRLSDAVIIAQLGNAYRFSVDWSKLQDKPFGQLNTEIVKDYREFMGKLKDRGLHNMLVLHHFANPIWFEKLGSWKNEDSPIIFADFAGKVAESLGDLVDSWNTINEPTTFVGNGYQVGLMPPNKKNPFEAIRVMKNLSTAHAIAYEEIKISSDKPIGTSNATMNFFAQNFLGKPVAAYMNKKHLEKIPDKFLPADFIGISYYGRVPFCPLPAAELMKPGKLDRIGYEHDKMWAYDPQGLEKVIAHFSKRYNLPIIITENGCCTDDDSQRIRSIYDHLSAVHSAIENGNDVKGYFHWSTFDNFELHLGPTWRFGLVEADSNGLRKIKNSGKYYSKISKTGILSSPDKIPR